MGGGTLSSHGTGGTVPFRARKYPHLNPENSENYIHTVKALLSPRGAYLILDLPEGGLIERGAY